MTPHAPRRARGLAAALLTTALVAPLGAALATPAVAADDPRTATLVGDLQSEASDGACEDWSPGCGATLLTQVEGTSRYVGEFQVPAGTWQYKVAIDGAWDEAYPEGPDNLDLPLAAGTTLRFTFDDETKAVGVEPVDLAPATVTREDRRLAQRSLRAGLTAENFYFVMADRFANGDPSNDTGGIEGDRLDHGYDPTDKGFYHGGDLAGLLEEIDYIEDLGTTAIWLTPSFKNRPVQGVGADVSAGYHGYWITDFTQIDPHLGTNEEMKALVDEAHSRGMKVFFDIITNHTADVIDYEEGVYDYVPVAERPWTDASGAPFDPYDYAGTDTFPELDAQTSFPYTPYFRTPEDATVKVPDWLNDPTLYHNRGDSTFAGESSEWGDFIGLDDLMTEHPTVVDGMGDVYETWVDLGIDGFRIDTVKHVNMEFWQDFGPRLVDHAAEQGNDDFFMFGEVYDGNPSYLSRFSTEGRLQATIDFAFQAQATSVAQGNSTDRLANLFAEDDWYTDADSNAYSSPTFLGNHDMGRIGRFLTESADSDEELLERSRLAHSIMYLTRGQPVVYYGDEQGFVGDAGDKDAREDMFGSQVASYNDNDLIGTDATTADENFDTDHPLYTHIADLAALREAHPALADGVQVPRYASDEAGLMVVSRVDLETDREYVVAINSSEETAVADVQTFDPATRFTPLLDGDALRTDREGRVQVEVPALSARVWRASTPVKASRSVPEVILTSPVDGGPVVAGTAAADGRAEVRASVPSGDLADVTFAWRPVGGEEWTTLGTDDNAPYRVFHDVRDLPVGTMVEYRAVLLDQRDRVSVDGSWGVVSEAGTGGGGGGGVGEVVQPDAVSVPGSHGSEMGCPGTSAGPGNGDWEPGCEAAQLSLDPDSAVWSKTFTDLPAGQYAYKAAIDRTWDESYGTPSGQDISYSHDGGDLTFYYDHRTKHASSTAQGPIITVPGDFQSEMGCAADWDPACMRSWLQDPDGDGVYTLATTQVPAGSYEAKVAHGLSWDESYGQGGTPDGADYTFEVGAGQVVELSYVLETRLLTITTRAGGGDGGTTTPDLSVPKAHWLSEEWLAWPASALPAGVDPRTIDWRLHVAPEGGLELLSQGVAGGDSAPLTWDPDGLPAELQETFRHLADHVALRLDTRLAGQLGVDVGEALTGQLGVVQYDELGVVLDAAGVQIPGVLDDRYAGAADADLGVTWSGSTRNPRPTVRLWAPTAKDVELLVSPVRSSSDGPQVARMRQDADGVWSVSGVPNWRNAEYTFRVTVYVPSLDEVVVNEVTDPYSVALTTNSERSVMVDLDDAALAPAQWLTAEPPTLAQPEDQSIYELHVRDFSVGDPEVPAEHRGTYLAFTDEGQGRQHLRELADAGLTTVHLLPTFDIASIEEDPAAQAEPACDLGSFAPDSPEQQACVGAVRADDAFNWGYDPYHWMAPEGSYATQREGGARVAEFRSMVGALHADGFQVVLDVVFNHTAASGQADRSVLDKIVPGYYHRLNPDTGAVEQSTCCENIATEHAMAEKIMVDALVVWARDHKVDGFRFDLMGHHSVQNMQAVRDGLDALTVAEDGVDGSRVVIYGEGWNFGEVADDARFDQARQGALDGTEIGTFSDRLRDAVRGGGPFDEDPRVQGLGSGLLTDPNDSPANGSAEEQLQRLLLTHDQVKVGMAGNLEDFRFVGQDGEEVTGADVDYNGQPAGYASDPSEVITYVDKHDNETLFDALTYKLPADTPMADRVRMNTVSLATSTLSQTPVFWHAGSDLLRSKSLDRNSYDSGDWFNQLDWTGEDNGFARGLPPAWDNEAKWPYAQPLLADPALAPDATDVAAASAAAADLLRIRYSSPLFRLGDAATIQDRVAFPVAGSDQEPGVVVMHLDDTTGDDLDPRWEGVLVVVNASPETVSQTVDGLEGADLGLHPVQAEGADDVVRATAWDAAAGTVTVPARTVAVLVQE